MHEFLNLLKSGELINHLTITLQEVFIGFFIGIFAGIGMGLLFRWKQTLAKIFLPYIQFLYSTPYVAIVPLLMLWVGIDLFFKIASVVIAVLPIMTIQTYEGTRTVEKDFVNLLRSMKFSNFQIVKKVALPSSLFFIFTGMRLSFGRAVVIAIVAEFQASTAGIGYLIQYSAQTFDTTKLLVGVFIISLISVLIIRLLVALEKYIIKWHPS
ncbi:MAG: ABC transporter permease [Candidatus Aenigmarchaeota archaeon]|nr:ABC transporter permease [Candidatus Aenigmarchaeota archaeon]